MYSPDFPDGTWHLTGSQREHLTDALVQLIEAEQAARFIRCFAHVVVPGMLQIPEYTKAVLGFLGVSGPRECATLTIRQARRSHLLSRTDAVECRVLLDGSLLEREIGGPALMAAQLQSIVENVVRTPLLQVRILPCPLADMAVAGAFILVDGPHEQDTVLYREDTGTDAIIRSVEEVARNRVRFDAGWDRALDDEESVHLLHERISLLTDGAHGGGLEQIM